jgi:hypothetical protein
VAGQVKARAKRQGGAGLIIGVVLTKVKTRKLASCRRLIRSSSPCVYDVGVVECEVGEEMI